MIYVQFIIGFMLYTGIAIISYSSEEFKNSPAYFPLGLVFALMVNLIWLWVSKNETNVNALMIKSLYWDAMLTIAYLLVPLTIFESNLSNNQIYGLILVLIGLVLTKIGGG